MNLEPKDRTEAAIAVLLVAAGLAIGAIYVIGRYLLAAIVGVF